MYPGNCELSTTFAWGRVLERYLASDLAGAGVALFVARQQNPHTQSFINGRKRLPRQIPATYTLGSKEEAVCFAEGLRQAWRPHPEALLWLAGQK
jgi:hypothetical protein